MLGGSVRVKEKHLLTLLEPTTVITTQRERKREQERVRWGKALRCRLNQRQLWISLLIFLKCRVYLSCIEDGTSDGFEMII